MILASIFWRGIPGICQPPAQPFFIQNVQIFILIAATWVLALGRWKWPQEAAVMTILFFFAAKVLTYHGPVIQCAFQKELFLANLPFYRQVAGYLDFQTLMVFVAGLIELLMNRGRGKTDARVIVHIVFWAISVVGYSIANAHFH